MQTSTPDTPIATLKGWDYLAILRQQYRIICICVAIFVFFAVAARFLLPQKYESRVVTIPAASGEQRPAALDALTSLGFSLGGSASPKEIAVATLNSRAFLTGFIKQENLAHTLFADKWDMQNQRWKGNGPTDEEAFDKLYGAMAVDSSATDNLITVRVRWTNSPTAAWIANRIVQDLNQKFRGKAVAESDRMIRYLSESYQNVQISEVRTNIANLIQDQIRQRILAQSREEYTLTVVDPAFPTVKRITPGLGIMIPIAVIVGLMLGVVMAFLAHAAKPKWPAPLANWLVPRP